MRNHGASFSALLLVAAAACGGTSNSSSESQPIPSSEAGADTDASPVVDGSTPDDAAPDGGSADSSTPDAAAAGTVRGHAFTYAHGIAYPRSVGNGLQGYEIFLSDKPIDCATATLEGSTTVDIDVAGQPPAAKTYAVIDAFGASAGPNDATSDFNAVDATCGTLASDASVSGTVVLTKFDALAVEGKLDVTYQSNARVKEGSVKGTFAAVVCPKFPAITCTPH